MDDDGEEREIGDRVPIVGRDYILPEIVNMKENLLVVSPELIETQSPKIIPAREINPGLSNEEPRGRCGSLLGFGFVCLG